MRMILWCTHNKTNPFAFIPHHNHNAAILHDIPINEANEPLIELPIQNNHVMQNDDHQQENLHNNNDEENVEEAIIAHPLVNDFTILDLLNESIDDHRFHNIQNYIRHLHTIITDRINFRNIDQPIVLCPICHQPFIRLNIIDKIQHQSLDVILLPTYDIT
jgi:hypothetical protein